MEPKSVIDQLDEMSTMLSSDAVEEVVEELKEPKEEVIEDGVKEDEVELGEKKDVVVDDLNEPVKPVEPVEPTEPDELTKLRTENESLRNKYEELHGKKVEPEPEPKKEEPKEEKLTFEEINFLGDSDMDELSRDPKKFNDLLNKVFQQGVETTRKVLAEGVFKSIPDMVKNNVLTTIALRQASEQFYVDNEDLKPFKKVVAAVYEEVAAEHPDKKINEILVEVGTEARKRLELHLKATKPTNDNNDRDKKPKLPRKKGQPSRGDQPKPEGLMNEIDEMNKILEV